MNILGVGPLELTLIVIIALIILGPNDMVKAGRTLGRWMRKIVLSPEWKAIQNASREFRTLPNKLIREAGIEEAQQAIKNQVTDIKKISHSLDEDLRQVQTDLSSWTNPSPLISSSESSSQAQEPHSTTSNPHSSMTEKQ